MTTERTTPTTPEALESWLRHNRYCDVVASAEPLTDGCTCGLADTYPALRDAIALGVAWAAVEAVKVTVVQGVEGVSVYLNGHRIAGEKPWGGGSVIGEFLCPAADLHAALLAREEGSR